MLGLPAFGHRRQRLSVRRRGNNIPYRLQPAFPIDGPAVPEIAIGRVFDGAWTTFIALVARFGLLLFAGGSTHAITEGSSYSYKVPHSRDGATYARSTRYSVEFYIAP